MINISIKDVAEYCKGILNEKAEEIAGEFITGASIDTRTIEAGNLFIPFKGENVDGHRFISSAFEKGAGAALTEEPIENSDSTLPMIHVEDGLSALQMIAERYLQLVNPKVIAITGSNGKTTTKDMVECLLKDDYNVRKTIGNYNNEIGLPLTVLELDRDTEISILEMGMDQTGDINFLSRLTKPDIAIITNVGESHIEKLGSREKIAEAKYEIVNGMKDGGVLICSKDYPLLNDLTDAEKNPPFEIHTAGISPGNDYTISNISQTESGTDFVMSDFKVEIPQLGTHNAMNAALSLLAVKALGENMEKSSGKFKKLKVSSMRMEQSLHESGALIINDAYNASPSSMKSAINTVSEMGYNKKILVLGDILELGDYTETLHRSIGEHIASMNQDFELLTYGEHSYLISEESGAKSSMHFSHLKELSDHLKGMLNNETVVLLKGSRGMEMERVNGYIR